MDSSKPLAFSLEMTINRVITADCHAPHIIEAWNKHTRSEKDCFREISFHEFTCENSVRAQFWVPSQLSYTMHFWKTTHSKQNQYSLNHELLPGASLSSGLHDKAR